MPKDQHFLPIYGRETSRAPQSHRAWNGGGEDPKIKKRWNTEPEKQSIQEAGDDHTEHGAQCQMLERRQFQTTPGYDLNAWKYEEQHECDDKLRKGKTRGSGPP